MLINAIITVLRETLEAGVLVGLLLLLTRDLKLRFYWLFGALSLGITSAVLYASMLGTISEWFD